MRVHVLYEHDAAGEPHGCSYIRLLLPLTHPVNADALSVTSGTEYQSADVLIVERTWSPGVTVGAAETLMARARQDGARVVYSIDDDLLEARGLTTEQRMVVRFFAREADGVLVSTDQLAARLRRLNPFVAVVPNALDERLFPSPPRVRRPGRPLVVGYMGTFTHGDDLMMVYQALRELSVAHRDRVGFELVGGTADPGVLRALSRLPARVVRPGGKAAYPAFLRWMVATLNWDLAIAPLDETAFTAAKSDIKFLDYGALGVAGVYSNVAAYRETVRQGVTGYLVDHSVEAWFVALDHLFNSAGERLGMAQAAHDYVVSNRTLAVCGRQWCVALERLANHRMAIEPTGRRDAR
jgi:glycosyltransferase involved in cell wall biosynthesis